MGITVLSLFDGMSCGQVALERAGIKVDKYYASEIDKYAIKIAKKNYPNTIHLGDINNWRDWDIEKPDLIIGGSPCQGFSFAGKQLAFNDARSRLFFVMMDIIKHYQSKYKLLENVRMAQKNINVITLYFQNKPVLINSALFSAQSRNRLYWFNWDLPTINNLNITTSDIIDVNDKSLNSDGWQKWWIKNSEFQLNKKYSAFCNLQEKAICMTARQVASWNGNLVKHDEGIRFINPIEAERLQTLPDNYTEGVSNTQRYKMIGNGWTIDVITHILKGMELTEK